MSRWRILDTLKNKPKKYEVKDDKLRLESREDFVIETIKQMELMIQLMETMSEDLDKILTICIKHSEQIEELKNGSDKRTKNP